MDTRVTTPPKKIIDYKNYNNHSNNNPTASNFSIDNYDIIESNNGGDSMKDVTREEFESRLKLIDIKIESTEKTLKQDIELAKKDVILEIYKLRDDSFKWVIGVIAVPIALFIIQQFIK